MELDCDGVGAGEGSGDGGAAVLLVPYKAIAIIDLNIITLQTITVPTNIKTIKCEGKRLSIGWLHLPNLQAKICAMTK